MLAFCAALVLANAIVFAWCPHTLIFSSLLNLFQCLDVVGCEGIPDRAGILWHRLQGCFICCIFQPLIGGLDVLPEEAHGLVDFVADISDVSIPLEVRGDFNSKIFWLGFCAKSVTVTMELVL